MFTGVLAGARLEAVGLPQKQSLHHIPPCLLHKDLLNEVTATSRAGKGGGSEEDRWP